MFLLVLVENVDIPLGVGRGAVVVWGVEAELFALADSGDEVVLLLGQLDLLKVVHNAVCEMVKRTPVRRYIEFFLG